MKHRDYVRRRIAKDREFAEAYRELETEFEIARQVMRLRLQRGLTQAELARRAGTKQPGIARLEGGTTLPSLSFLRRLADALDAKLEVKLTPNKATAARRPGAGRRRQVRAPTTN